MSKSPTRHLGKLKGTFKVTEKEKNIHIYKFLLYFQYSNVVVVGRFQYHLVYKISGFKFRCSLPHPPTLSAPILLVIFFNRCQLRTTLYRRMAWWLVNDTCDELESSDFDEREGRGLIEVLFRSFSWGTE